MVSLADNYVRRYLTNHAGQLSLAIPSWVGTMSTSQKAVMPMGLKSKGGYSSCVGGR